jgi:hypothetical protein
MKSKIRYTITAEERAKAAKHCRSTREMDNLSQREMAEDLGTFVMAISRIEAMNHRSPTWLVKKFCEMSDDHAAPVTLDPATENGSGDVL